MALTWSLSAMAMACVAAASFYPALVLRRRGRLAAFLVLGTAVALAPLVIPPDQRLARFFAAVFAAILLMKMWDLHVGALRENRLPFRDFLAFLVNLPFLVLRRQGFERQPTPQENFLHLGLGVLGVGAAFAALELLSQFDWSGLPFLLEHSLKATAFFLGLIAVFQLSAATTRLLGGYTVDPGGWFLTASTPAEFWRQYNRIVGQFLHEDVFKPLQGRRHPVRTTLMVFAVSGLLHEYLFSVAISRLQGFQLLFFLLQGCAVALTQRVNPTGREAVAWGFGTFAFNVTSSVFFLASVHGVTGFYQGGLPTWLRGW